MPEFDPYHRWLSISPEEQPPTHYRLLGVKPFESDPDAIESAADRQMAHVRSFQSGKHAAWSQKLLNELSAAKICLLAPAPKAAYDRELRARSNAAAPPPPAAKPQIGVAKPLPTARPLADARRGTAAMASGSASEDLAGLGFDPLDRRGSDRRTKRQKSTLSLPIVIAGGVGLAVAGAAAWIAFNHGTGEPLDGRAQQIAARSGQTERSSGGGLRKNSASDTPEPLEGSIRMERPEASNQPASESGEERSAAKSPDAASVNETTLPPERTSAARPPAVPGLTLPEDESPPGVNQPSAPEPFVPVADSDSNGKSGLPNADELVRIANEIKAAFADDYARAKSREQKGNLARKLLVAARKTGAPETRYGLLDQARQLAGSAGDYELAMEAIVGLSAVYPVDAVALKCEALSAAAPAARGAQRIMLSATAMRLADEALDAEHFDQAQSMAKVALSLARGAKDVALVKAATAAAKQISELVPAYQDAHKALAKLETSPDDAEANLLAGKFLCLVKWDWPRGLPLLAKSSNGELRALATRELTPTASADAQAELADAWWDLAKRSRGFEKFDLEQHAGQLYLRSVEQLTGTRKQTAERRIKELADKFPSEPASAGSGLIPTTNEFAARRTQTPTLQPGVCPEGKLQELVDQWAPGFSVKWTGIEVIAEHFGRKNVLRTHPGGEEKPGTFYGRLKVPARVHTRLELTVASAAEGDWDLIVKVDDRIVHKSTVDMRSATKGWRDVTIDLTSFAGQTVELQAMNKNTGWYYEWGLWDRIAVITSR